MFSVYYVIMSFLDRFKKKSEPIDRCKNNKELFSKSIYSLFDKYVTNKVDYIPDRFRYRYSGRLNEIPFIHDHYLVLGYYFIGFVCEHDAKCYNRIDDSYGANSSYKYSRLYITRVAQNFVDHPKLFIDNIDVIMNQLESLSKLVINDWNEWRKEEHDREMNITIERVEKCNAYEDAIKIIEQKEI
jgi:hypothetical protein